MTSSSTREERRRSAHLRYWRRNVLFVSVLLLIWASVGLGCGVLFADSLNAFSLGGIPLGFWFAQQGSIIVFVLLILVYAGGMRVLDRRLRSELHAADEGEA